MERAKSISTIRVLVVTVSLVAVFNGVDFFLSSTQAAEGYTTATHDDLISLPPPKDKIAVAVYHLRDQRGQDTSSALFSTAVAQGATTILHKALENSGWFVPIERQGLPSLLNEREIINTSQQQNQPEAGKKLPPLLYAGVLLEGDIIVYKTDEVSADLRAKYFGAGESAQLRKDSVTVCLRLVYVRNGQILKSVTTTRSILSKEVDLGVYKFVRMKKLLEAEIGLSAYEPSFICAQEAIERAVFDLIVEGVQDGVWSLKDPEDIESPVIQNYFEEKKQTGKMVAFVEKSDLAQVEASVEPEPEVIDQSASEIVTASEFEQVVEEAGSDIVEVDESGSDATEVTSIDVVISEANDVAASEPATEKDAAQSDSEEVETAEAIEPDDSQEPEPGIIIVDSEVETEVANLEVSVGSDDCNNVAATEEAENIEAEIQAEAVQAEQSEAEPADATEQAVDTQVAVESESAEVTASGPNDVAASESEAEVKPEPDAMVIEKTPEPVAVNLEGDMGSGEAVDATISEDAENAIAEEAAEESEPADANSASLEPNDVEATESAIEKTEDIEAVDETEGSEETETAEESESTDDAEANDIEASSEAAADSETEEAGTSEPNNDADAEVAGDAEEAVTSESVEASEEAEATDDTQNVEPAESAEASDANTVTEPEIGDVEKPKPEALVVEKDPEPAASNLEKGLVESESSESEAAESSEPNEVAESESADVTESDPNNVEQDTEDVAVEKTKESEDTESAAEETESADVTESDPNNVDQDAQEVADSDADVTEESDPNEVTESEEGAEQQADSGSAEESDSEDEEQSESSSEAEAKSSDDSKAWWE